MTPRDLARGRCLDEDHERSYILRTSPLAARTHGDGSTSDGGPNVKPLYTKPFAPEGA
jgi:hypothetical protein